MLQVCLHQDFIVGAIYQRRASRKEIEKTIPANIVSNQNATVINLSFSWSCGGNLEG